MDKVKVTWIKNGNDYQRVEGECDNVDKLPVGIYTVHLSDQRGWWLEFYREKFTFDYKIYGVDDGFIDYFMETYNNTTGNLGVMFNGTKGTGKTVTAKVMANRLNMPVIIVKGMEQFNPALMEFLSSFNFDCIYFFDEFEKNFRDDDSSVLQIMDGVYNSEYRKIFLLTTNRTRVNENLLSRPSRILYVKEFKNISKELVDEYMEDNLNDKDAKDLVFSYIDGLEVSTIDILKTAVQEVNIHGADAFKKNMKNLNADRRSMHYYCYFLPVEEDRRLTIDDFISVCSNWEESHGYKGLSKLSAAKLNPLPDFLGTDSPVANEAKVVPWGTFKQGEKRSKANAGEFDSILPTSGYSAPSTITPDEMNVMVMNLRTCWTVTIDLPYRKLKEGDEWYNNEKIVGIDYNRAVIVTAQGGNLNYYLIKNPDENESLYQGENFSRYSFLL